jgi:hypothetical protein
MHSVLLYRIGNVLFLVSHTGMATGIRIAYFLTSRSRCTRIEITPFEPDQRSYLRREAPSVLHRFLSVPPSSRRGGRYRITDPLCFTPRLGKVGLQTSMFTERTRQQSAYLLFLQQLHRSWHFIENFAASFVAMNFIGGVRCDFVVTHLIIECGDNTGNRAGFFLGLLAGGPAAIW